jgi:NADH dehydrogenase
MGGRIEKWEQEYNFDNIRRIIVDREDIAEVSMKVFLCGGTGFVGRHVVDSLRKRGHEVVLLVHKRGGISAQGIEQVEGDITIPATFIASLKGCDSIINLIGIIREFPSRGVTFEALHVQGTKNLLTAAKKTGINRIIHMSALAARPDAAALYHRTKFIAEDFIRGSGLEWTIFRPSIIFGPEDEFVNKLAGQVRNFPLVPVIGDGTYRLQPIAAGDVAACFAMALEMPDTMGQTYELCGPDRFTYNGLIDAVGLAIGKPHVRKIRSPVPLMKIVVPIFQRFSFFPITMDQMTMLLEENIGDCSWIEIFRFQPERFAEGIARYLRP